MNWVLIIVLLILAYQILRGYRKGFLRIVYSLVAWLVVLVFVAWSTPYINNFLMEHTGLYEKVETYCEEKVREKAEEKTEEELNSQNSELEKLGINLPEAALNNILEKTTGAADEFLETSGVYSQMAKALANFVVQGISFFVALIGAWIVVQIIAQMLGIVSKIPVLKGANRFLGIFAGGIYGIVLVWIAFYIVALCSASEFGGEIITCVYQSEFLKFFYENNLVLTLILYFL